MGKHAAGNCENNRGLPHQDQEATYWSYCHLLTGSSLKGSKSSELETGLEPRFCDMGHAHILTQAAKTSLCNVPDFNMEHQRGDQLNFPYPSQRMPLSSTWSTPVSPCQQFSVEEHLKLPCFTLDSVSTDGLPLVLSQTQVMATNSVDFITPWI